MNLIEVGAVRRPLRPHGAGRSRSRAARRPTAWPGAASFGSRAAYIGKIRDDQLGAVFAHDIRAAGVHFDDPGRARRRPHGAAA